MISCGEIYYQYMNRRNREGRRGNQKNPETRMRRVPVSNADKIKNHENREQEVVRMTLEVASNVKDDYGIAQLILQGGGSLERALKSFPEGVEDMPELKKTLRALIQNENIDSDEFIVRLEGEGFTAFFIENHKPEPYEHS